MLAPVAAIGLAVLAIPATLLALLGIVATLVRMLSAGVAVLAGTAATAVFRHGR